MTSGTRRLDLAFVAFCAVIVLGCGKSSPKLVPVSGVVVNGDKPVASAAISFAGDVPPSGEAPSAYGSLDEKGHFKLETVSPRGSGVPAGRYKVVITTDGPSSRLIPQRVTNMASTPVIIEIPEAGVQDLKIDLAKYK